MTKHSLSRSGGRAYTSCTLVRGMQGGSTYGLEGGLCYGATGAVREGGNCGCASSLALLLGFPKTLSLYALVLPPGSPPPPPVCLITASETVLGGYSSAMRSRGTGATWFLGASFGTLILGTSYPSSLSSRSVHQFLPDQRP